MYLYIYGPKILKSVVNFLPLWTD